MQVGSLSLIISYRIFGLAPLAITISQPPFKQISAAESLVFIPPVPSPEEVSPASASISGLISSICLISFALGSMWGSAVNNPSISDSKISKSAEMLTLTNAESVSLSPTLISSVATVSF